MLERRELSDESAPQDSASIRARLRRAASPVIEPRAAWQRVVASTLVAVLTIGAGIEASHHGVVSYSLIVLGALGVTWYTGLRSGLLFTIVAGVLSWVFIEEPRGEISVKEASLIRLSVGMLTAIIASCLLHSTRRAKALAEDLAESQAQLAAAELELMSLAALTDGLTRLGNQRAFQEDLKLEVARATRRESSLTLALMDVDQLKEINDSQGHVRGDEVLANVGRLLTDLRGTNRAYRIGGDEFALILEDTDGTSAISALERVRVAIEETANGVTVSVGLSTNENGAASADVLIENADAALYEAKRRGRNQVVSYAPNFQTNAGPIFEEDERSRATG